jgi:uncharacterized repeat protein (TIGR01451 family)
MKKHCILFIFCVFAFSASAQIINFPDANFKAKLLAADVTNNIARIPVYPAVNGEYLISVKLDANSNGDIELSEAAVISVLNVPGSNIASLSGIENFSGLKTLNCSNNLLTSLFIGTTGSAYSSQLNVDCSFNQLTTVDFSTVNKPLFLYCNDNQITSFDFSQMEYAMILNCSNNPLPELDFGGYQGIIGLTCSNTPVTTINLSGNFGCEFLTCNNNYNLTNLLLKDAVDVDADMGDMWSSFHFNNNPNLQYLCVSENRLNQAQLTLNSYGYINCAVSSYCDFSPGAPYYNVQGTNKLDINMDGCDAADSPYPNLKLNITDGSVSGIIPSSSGNYAVSVVGGSHTITPVIEMPAYYTVTPPSITVSFPAQPSPVTQNFCITPNGNHNDIEVTFLALSVARPGFDAYYKLICKNKGTTAQAANVNLVYEDVVLDVTDSFPLFSMQSANTLSWTLTSLAPFETREITITFNVNGPMEVPAVNAGDVLDFALTATAGDDETPDDNSSVFYQTIVNSLDPNDKTCLEGNAVTPDMIGKYIHYLIRFENTGTFPAENIVVKDIIDGTKFDIGSLVPLHSSHSFITRTQTGNKVEFIFENINLPFDDANNDGYVAFKIKTKPTLVIGDTFSNTASIYFDYNFPIVTNTATTAIQLLGNPDFEFSKYFTLYPNPAKNILNIESKNSIQLKSAEIYNMLGQLVLAVTNMENVSSMDVSDLTSGNYFIKVSSDKGTSSAKFIKK